MFGTKRLSAIARNLNSFGNSTAKRLELRIEKLERGFDLLEMLKSASEGYIEKLRDILFPENVLDEILNDKVDDSISDYMRNTFDLDEHGLDSKIESWVDSNLDTLIQNWVDDSNLVSKEDIESAVEDHERDQHNADEDIEEKAEEAIKDALTSLLKSGEFSKLIRESAREAVETYMERIEAKRKAEEPKPVAKSGKTVQQKLSAIWGVIKE